MVGNVFLDVDDIETIEPRTDLDAVDDSRQRRTGERERQTRDVVGEETEVADNIGVDGHRRIGADVDVVEHRHRRGDPVPAGQARLEDSVRGVEQPYPGVEVD